MAEQKSPAVESTAKSTASLLGIEAELAARIDLTMECAALIDRWKLKNPWNLTLAHQDLMISFRQAMNASKQSGRRSTVAAFQDLLNTFLKNQRPN